MSEGLERGAIGAGWPALLTRFIGTTVTIFTSSGGQSGSGFTGVLLTVNPVFVRLITRIGPPPGCSLGNACTGFSTGDGWDRAGCGCGGPGYGAGYEKGTAGYGAGFGKGPAGVPGAFTAGGWDGMPVWTVGSVTDIPTASIVSFVHDAI